MLCLSDIATVKRTGPLIEASTNYSEVLDAIGSAAIEVTEDKLHFRARSASEAAAWLIRGAHDNALGPDLRAMHPGTVRLQHFFGLNRLLGFRGQNTKYNTIIPSIFRKSHADRIIHGRARDWFATAINAWHNSYFRYANGKIELLGIEQEVATGVAQHYGIATSFVDWTWDPLVAMAFAVSGSSPGEFTSIFIRPFGPSSRPEQRYDVFLPPSFAGRIWQQRGFFSWQPVAPEYFDISQISVLEGGYARYLSKSDNYFRISFPVASEDVDWAMPQLSKLYCDDFVQLLELSSWCLKAAAVVEDISPYRTWDKDKFIRECERLKLQPPTLFTTPPSDAVTGENVVEMMDYFEMMALRCRPVGGRLAYHKPALQTALVAIPELSFPLVGNSNAASKDRRAAVFPPSPLLQLRWGEDIRKFDPAQDLRSPSDEFFVDAISQ